MKNWQKWENKENLRKTKNNYEKLGKTEKLRKTKEKLRKPEKLRNTKARWTFPVLGIFVNPHLLPLQRTHF